MDGSGTYTLLVTLAEGTRVAFGAAGERDLPAGAYAYVGTALGSGGFSRVERHRDLARGDREVRHWHVDYLLGAPESALERVVTTEGVDAECTLADELAGRVPAVAGLGASDCDCSTHLFGPADAGRLEAVVEAAHERVRGGR